MRILLALLILVLACSCKDEPVQPDVAPPAPAEPLARGLVDVFQPAPKGHPPTLGGRGLTESLLKPVGGLPLPELAKLTEDRPDLPVYEVEASRDELQRFYEVRGFTNSVIRGTDGVLVQGAAGARLHIIPGKGRISQLRFYLKALPEPTKEEAARKAEGPDREAWKADSDRVRKALESGNNKIGEILGPDFPD